MAALADTRGLLTARPLAAVGTFRGRELVESRSMASGARRRSKSLPVHLPEAAPGEVLVWTDGACQRNPGPGGWGALLCWEDGVVEERSGGLAVTTNNIMELTAALQGCARCRPGHGCAS